MGKETRDDRFILIDIETTGLNLHKDSLLEIGFCITDPDLNIIHSIQRVIYFPEGYLDYYKKSNEFDPWVLETHTKNNLFKECADKNTSYELDEVERDLKKWFDIHAIIGLDALTGSSLAGFDRPWLRLWFPELEKRFHYRNTDISTLKELCKKWHPNVTTTKDHVLKPRKLHRVLPDIQDSIDELKFYRLYFIRT